MYVIVLLITLSSCINSYNFDKKEKMKKAIDNFTSKVFNNPEVEGTINSVVRFAFRPVRLLIDLANAEIDEHFLKELEKKIESKKEKARVSKLMRCIKNKDVAKLQGLLQEEEKVDWKNRLINLNEEITLNNGSRTTYANFILGKGCYNKEILKIIVKNFPKKDKGFYSIHIACILGSEDFVKKLIEKDGDCLEYVSEEESIRMNSLAYASMFNHENLVKQLLEQGIRSHEGYMLSVILGNHRIEKLCMEEVYKEKTSIFQLKEVVKDLGVGNNVFHILPLIKYLKEVGSIAEENDSTKLKFMQGKRDGILLNNLLEKLKWMEFTIEDIRVLLKSKNEEGRTALEHIVLSGDEELYVAIFDAIKKVFDVEDGNSLLILEPNLELLSKVLVSSVELGLSGIIEDVLDLFQIHENAEIIRAEIIRIVMLALYEATGLHSNEAVFLICKWISREVRSPISLKLSESSDIAFLDSLSEKLESFVHTDISYKAVDLRDIGNMSLEDTEGDYNRTIFHYAVMFGNEALVGSIINRIETLGKRDRLKLLNRKDGEGKTVFHLCFESNCSNILRRLWDCRAKAEDKGDSIKQVDKKGNTPLHYARSVEILRRSERLLGNKFREVCNCKNEAGRNVLMQYISDLIELKGNSKEVINFLLKNYDYNSRDKEGKSLEMLMVEKDEDFFYDYLKDIFKKKGFDKKQKDINGNNLLHYVAKYSKEGKCTSLFDNKSYCDLGGEKNKDGLKARYIAVEEDNSKVLQLMLERYKEVKGEKKFEEKANKMMVEAVNNKKNAVIAMLIDMGIEKTRKGMKRSFSTESLFEDKKVEIDYIGIMEEGLKLGSRIVMEKVFEYEDKFPSDMDESIKKIIEEKIEENSTEAASYIIDRYAKRNKLEDEKDKQIMFTILVRAIKANKNNFFKSLMENEIIKKEMISYKKNSNEVTLLHMACLFGRDVIAKLLIEKGTEIEASDKNGGRALMLAAGKGHIEVCKLLIEKGAEIEASDSNGFRTLMIAAVKGQKEVCELLIEKGAEIEAANKGGVRALMLAAGKGHIEICRLLIEKGAEIEATNGDEGGARALMLAANNGHKEVCELLIEKGAEIEAANGGGFRALMLAAHKGHKEVCVLLIDRGAEIEAANKDGKGALMLAAREGRREVCELLIEKGAEIEASDSDGLRALMLAAINGYKEVCELLIEKGAEIEASNKYGTRALMLAAINGGRKVCELLIEKGAEIEVSDSNGFRALMLAAINGYKEVCELLIEKGAEIEAANVGGFRALMLAANKGHKEVCDLLIERGAEVNAANEDGWTAVMLSAFNSHKEVCELLIEKGAEIEASNGNGVRVFMIAAQGGHKEVCELLIENGAEIEPSDGNGFRALMLAAQGGHKEVCELLIEKGAEIEASDSNGLRALMLAANKGHKEVCELLIENGAEIEASNKDGVRALMLAAQEGHKEVCELLIEKGAEIEASNKDGVRALMITGVKGHKEVCELLIEKGAEIEAVDKDGVRTLMLAAQEGHKEVCELLIENVAEIEAANVVGIRALMLAAQEGQKEVCELLIKKGAKVEAEKKDGVRALMLAAYNGQKEVCKLLIENEEEIEASDSNGLRALMLAAQEGHKELCELLIELGAEVEAANKDGKRALMLGAVKGHKEVCELL
ncbi:MAG: hypothetical protein CMN86_09280, partial [Stappia sp.]|nr:hypothetical protein [Stappia sp.]